ncbi:hypothetical protein AVEN_185597-1, partial [Araneus ventricosus]
MAFLGKARKEDLIILARELGEEVTPDLKIIDLIICACHDQIPEIYYLE